MYLKKKTKPFWRNWLKKDLFQQSSADNDFSLWQALEVPSVKLQVYIYLRENHDSWFSHSVVSQLFVTLAGL